jgi:Uma2 family endonuclease
MIAKAQQTEPHRRSWTPEEFGRLKALGFFGDEPVELVEGDIILRNPATRSRNGVRYSSDEPQLRLWTRDECYRLADLGFFEGQKAELWGGEIMVASPQGPGHFIAIYRTVRVLETAWGVGVCVRMQGPLTFALIAEPEPDVAVVPGRWEDYTAEHPKTALLVVEVSDSTLAGDRGPKASLYAAGGITDYWIINLVQGQLEVYRQPVADASQPHGHRYARCTIYFRGQTITPLAAPSVSIAVSDLVP